MMDAYKASEADCGNKASDCAYNKSGVCILSDCKCQAATAEVMVCSAYKKKA